MNTVKIELYCGGSQYTLAHRRLADTLTQQFGGVTVMGGVGFWVDPDCPENSSTKDRCVVYSVITNAPAGAAIGEAVAQFLRETGEKEVLMFASDGAAVPLTLNKEKAE